MLKIEKPLLPFFSREKRFKAPTTQTAFNSSISYFTPSIKFKEDPELFLNGLIKNRNKEDKNIAGIFPTLEERDEKQSQVDKLKKIMTVPEKKYYDGTATIEKARPLSPTNVKLFREQSIQALQLMTENLVRAGYTKPKQGKRPPLEVQIASIQDRPPTIEASAPLVAKPPPGKASGGVNPKVAKDMEALMSKEGEKAVETFVFTAKSKKLLREAIQNQNLGSNVTPKMVATAEELAKQGLNQSQIIFELTRRLKEAKQIKPTGRAKSGSAIQIGGKDVGGGK